MQDVRIRTGTAMLLSIIAFMNLPGACAAFLWWILFVQGKIALLQKRALISSLLVIGFFSIVLEFTSGGGLSYFFRMCVIILIGTWLLNEQKPEEFLCLGTWLLGQRAGFELGMIAGMSTDALRSLRNDVSCIQTAFSLKRIPWNVRSIMPAGRILIHRALSRAEETAEVLAIRGYRCGGTLQPVFVTSGMDLVAGFCALLLSALVLIPVSEFFILSH